MTTITGTTIYICDYCLHTMHKREIKISFPCFFVDDVMDTLDLCSSSCLKNWAYEYLLIRGDGTKVQILFEAGNGQMIELEPCELEVAKKKRQANLRSE